MTAGSAPAAHVPVLLRAALEQLSVRDGGVYIDGTFGAGGYTSAILQAPATQVIGIDEANFLGPDLVEVATQLADSGKQVLIAGLDTDYMGRPFVPIPDLLCLAESITKTLAICMRCGNLAKHTQRLVENENLIVVGAAGMYEARCRRCFEPGLPRQESFTFARPAVTADGE